MMMPREALLKALNARPRPKGRPPGSVVPRLLPMGVLICPVCHRECVTPAEPNPYRAFEIERMILVPNKSVQCSHGCGAWHWITEGLARQHNRILYPEDYPAREEDP
jgi:hypothetical protein